MAGIMTEDISNADVLNMFGQLMSKMSSMEADIKLIKSDKDSNVKKISNIENAQNQQTLEIAQLKNENTYCKRQLHQLADALAYHKQVINELSSKMDRFELDKLKPYLIIQGIAETHKENTITTIKNFFKNEMKITQDIEIKFAHRIGKGKIRSIKVALTNPGDKGVIYSHSKNLQGKISATGRNYQD